MNSYRLRAALAANGWPDRYLSFDRRTARIDLRKDIIGFVPFNRWVRWLHRHAFMPIDRILTPGTVVEFDPVLSLALGFLGLTVPTATDDLFGRLLLVTCLREFDFAASDDTGQSWEISYIALTYTHDCFIQTGRY
jgi:hypothetical protein